VMFNHRPFHVRGLQWRSSSTTILPCLNYPTHPHTFLWTRQLLL
jgi:hypothetical protein